MVGVSSPVFKSASTSRLHAVSPSQLTARKLVRKYSLTNNRLLVGQRRELTALRTSLPHVKAASDLDVVLAAIAYIEQLQHKVVFLSQLTAGTEGTVAPPPRSADDQLMKEGRKREEMDVVMEEEEGMVKFNTRKGNERIDNRKHNIETNNN
jgi:hypothetical protein